MKQSRVVLPKINQKGLSTIPVPVPPKLEQIEIVQRVDRLFKLADKVEKQHQAAKQRTNRLTQSILAKAFRGELVPQDPNDEPASELLKRIKELKV
jgi:type I restriction enzyme S subunit